MEFYPGLNPVVFRSLTRREYEALVRHYEKRQRDIRKQTDEMNRKLGKRRR